MSDLGIVAALALESRPLGPRLQRTPTLATLADGSLITVSGIGRAAAAAGARRLVEAGAGALMSWGMAGGLDPALTAGTIVVPGEVVSPEGAVCATTRPWREQLLSALASSQPVCSGRLLSSREPIGSTAEKSSAWRRLSAVAVDMESFAIAEIAAERRVPFLAVRAIVDTAADPLPAVLVAAAAGVDPPATGRLLAGLVRAPAELLQFFRLMRRYRAAARALAVVARSGSLVPPNLHQDRGAGAA